MVFRIRDPETEQLAAEVAGMAGENTTEAIRTALAERRERLGLRIGRRHRHADLLRLLEQEIWPAIPRALLGKRVSRRDRERILGCGKEGL
jgi:antitoxin VapB